MAPPAFTKQATGLAARCFSSSPRGKTKQMRMRTLEPTRAAPASSLNSGNALPGAAQIPPNTSHNHADTIIRLFSRLGSSQTRDTTWQAHHDLHRPPSPQHLTMSALIAAGAHLGHSTSLASPAFLPYTYGTRAGLSVIDLDQTLPLLRRAANVTRAIAEADGLILFVGTGSEALGAAARKAASRLGANGSHIDSRWLPGLLTNPFEVLGDRAARQMNVKPDLVVFLNPLDNVKALRECGIARVPTIGIIDSNVDPRIVMYPIPANDESIRTAELIAGTLSVAGREGVQRRLEKVQVATQKSEGDRMHAAPVEAQQ